jgi:hypothetical protein
MTISRIPSVEGGIQPTLLTAKGDLISATAASTVARLAVGSNDQILVADSTTATGLKWATPAGGGKVLQVVSAAITTEAAITSTGYTDTNITGSITPTSATSKILVMVNYSMNLNKTSNYQYAAAKLLRGATAIQTWGDRPNGDSYFAMVEAVTSTGTMQLGVTATIAYLDSPATTSATTYKLQAKVAVSGTVYFQRDSIPSSIILMEIGA